MRGAGFFIVVFLIAAGCSQQDPKKPGYEFLSDMAHSIPYDAFAPNPNTADHKTLQLPPEGSIPREGFLPYHYEDAEKAGLELKSPFPKTAENLARGKQMYETFCLVCHGVEGKGDGPVIPKFPAPPSYKTNPVKDYPEGRLFHVVTRGVGLMSSYASQISVEDRWKLVQYVQTLQGASEVLP